jgi:predicted transcriptional regulator YdeE
LSIAIEDPRGEHFLEISKNEKYRIFKVDPYEEQGILNTWNKIWEQEEAGILKRAYSMDFEKYDPSGEVEIHIAIK